MSAFRLKMGEGVAGWVAQTGEATIVNDAARDPRFARKVDTRTQFQTRSILCAPLVSRGRTIGVVEIMNKLGGRFTRADLALVLMLVEPCAIAIENAMLFQRTEQLTITDDLTRLFNSRYLNLYLGREIKRCKRHGIPLSVIFLDLDGFKGVNDQYGHLAGSARSRRWARILAQGVRESDILARYGGDEFVVVLPETPAAGALVIAERHPQGDRGAPLPGGTGDLRAHLRLLRHRLLSRPRPHARGADPEGRPGHVPGEGAGEERHRGGRLAPAPFHAFAGDPSVHELPFHRQPELPVERPRDRPRHREHPRLRQGQGDRRLRAVDRGRQHA